MAGSRAVGYASGSCLATSRGAGQELQVVVVVRPGPPPRRGGLGDQLTGTVCATNMPQEADSRGHQWTTTVTSVRPSCWSPALDLRRHGHPKLHGMQGVPLGSKWIRSWAARSLPAAPLKCEGSWPSSCGRSPHQRQQQPDRPTGVGIDHQLQPRARRSDGRQRRPSMQRERAEPGHHREAADRLVLGDLHAALDPPAPVRPHQPRGRSDPHRPKGASW